MRGIVFISYNIESGHFERIVQFKAIIPDSRVIVKTLSVLKKTPLYWALLLNICLKVLSIEYCWQQSHVC